MSQRKLSRRRDWWQTQLWPAPTLAVAAAVAAGVGLPQLDRHLVKHLPTAVTTYLFGGGADAARTVLSSIASSLITVTSLTFSLTVVTLQLASSQFSPRLLRTFVRDRVVHATLALFLATFTYALTVLRTVRTGSDGQRIFVPQLSITLAYLLALASVITLVLFLAHLARQIRVETMLKNVHRDATAAARRGLAVNRARLPDVLLWAVPADAARLMAASSGFLISVDDECLLGAAAAADAFLVLTRDAGSFVVAGTPLASAWRHDGKAFEPEVLRHLLDRVQAATTVGFEATDVADIGFGLRQLTDVAIKALSPGINDPTTAIHALDHSSALLCELADETLGPYTLRERGGSVRVLVPRPQLADLLELAVTQPRRYGAADHLVMGRLFRLLQEVAWSSADPSVRHAVELQLGRLRATVAEQDFDAAERERLALLGTAVELAVVGVW